MSDELNYVDSSGGFTDSFREALPGILGDEHAESKVFDDITDVSTLAKSFADTKSMVGRKLDGVIQKPTESATDEDRLNYRDTLKAELGAPESVEGYAFDRPELPEGMTYDEGMESEFKDLFFQRKTNPEDAKFFVEAFNQMQLNRYNQAVEAQNKEFDESSSSLKTDWAGEQLPKNLRIALKAVKEFGSDELKKSLDDAKLFDNATDLGLWRKLGFSPDQLRVWHNIANKTLSVGALKDEGGGTPAKMSMKEMYPNSPELHEKS